MIAKEPDGMFCAALAGDQHGDEDRQQFRPAERDVVGAAAMKDYGPQAAERYSEDATNRRTLRLIPMNACSPI